MSENDAPKGENLYEKAMRLLGRPIKKSDDPGASANREDTRAADAAPTPEQLAEAGKEAAAGGGAGDQPGAVPQAPEGADGGNEGGQPNADGSPAGGDNDGDGDDYKDMSPDEVREVAKAFGLTTFDDIDDIKKGSPIFAVLKKILTAIEANNAYQENLREELAELKREHASGKTNMEGVLRETKKAVADLDEKQKAFQEQLLGQLTSPKTAPGAQGRAVTKAVDTQSRQPDPEPEMTRDDLFQLALSGKLSAGEVAVLNRRLKN